MVLEIAQVTVLPGHEAAFEAALLRAADEILARAAGVGEFVPRGWCVERPNVYLFTVEWATLDDHLVGFRESDLFTRWRAAIGPHFDGPSLVEHFATR